MKLPIAQITRFARSRQGQELIRKAKTAANDPQNREKLEQAQRRFLKRR